MLPEMKLPELSRLKENKTNCFPSEQCFVIHPEDEQSKQTNKQNALISVNDSAILFLLNTVNV